MTLHSLEPYRAAIHREICGPCPDRLPHGGCGRSADSPCTIQTQLPALVDAILSVGGSPDVKDYERALREKVCPACRQDADGDCDWRAHCGCTLDSLLLEVIDVVEATRDEGEGRPAG
jgi:hypothetical protein